MAKFIGETGLVYLWGKIKTWVQTYAKITSTTGKDTITMGNTSIDIYDWAQGSTKPSYTQDDISDGTTNKAFTATEKTKLSGISSGAEVNQNAFSNIKVGSTTIEADGKTDTVEFVGSGITITPDATNDKITFTAPSGVSPYTSDPAMNGSASAGSSDLYSRGDHVHPSDTSKISTSLIGAANGVCPLDSSSKIASTYLPSYVDDVIEAYARTGQTALSEDWLATGSASGTVIEPEGGKIYVLMAATTDYPQYTEFRWGGSAYVKINDGGISELTTGEMDTATNNWT